MVIVFACDCGWSIVAPEAEIGLRIRCPDCCELVRVPSIADLRLAAALASAGSPESATSAFAPSPRPVGARP